MLKDTLFLAPAISNHDNPSYPLISLQVMPNGTIGRKTKKRPQVFGDAFDDVHLCIMCLRAIMNHQYGFNMVIGHGGESFVCHLCVI